jgi:hypothetical protein
VKKSETNEAGVKSLVLVSKKDTIPVRIVIENPDGFLEVVKGVVVRHFWVTREDSTPSSNPVQLDYYTSAWKPIDPEVIFGELTKPLKPKQ